MGYQFPMDCTLCALATIMTLASCTSESHVRSVFARDTVKFSCASPTLGTKDSCLLRFKFGGQNQSVCGTDNARNNLESQYEVYAEVPENATGVFCKYGDETLLSVQNAEPARPISRDSIIDIPFIVMQRFTQDFSVRFGVHEVTNKNFSISGRDVDSIKLFCVSRDEVIWTNYTYAKGNLTTYLQSRDSSWLASAIPDKRLKERWFHYMSLLSSLDNDTFTPHKEVVGNFTYYRTVLDIKRLTNASSRVYQCQTKHNVSSSVSLYVEEPRTPGPDEIEMIQQILEIIADLQDGKGNGKEPWKTLAPLLSIVLVLFIYYCKKKLEQQSQVPPAAPNPKPPAETEETEMRVRLRHPEPEARTQDNAENERMTTTAETHT